MLLSYNWLKELINIEDNAYNLAEKITRSGLEVEEVLDLSKNLSNIVVGYVKEKQKHPNAEKLSICTVDVGEEELQIVCGAPNVEKGQYVIVAKIGAKLNKIKIKKAKLRSIESQGMLCSLEELGINSSQVPKEYQNGIFVFNKKQELGADVVKLLGLDDKIIDIAITPNRADALSMRGIFYEVCAIYDKKDKFKEIFEEKEYEKTDLKINSESESCKTYFGQVIKNVTIEPSPLWVQMKLIKSGVRPINNVVDITNYVMLEYGQPMHAFDKDKLGDKILIREACDGEKIITLDGIERELKNNELVITDTQTPVAIAGVMGGENTEVTNNTKNIVFESAYFSADSIRKTSSQHNLRSESSQRFEKGVDPNLQKKALNRAVELLKEICPNIIVEEEVFIDTSIKEEKIEVTSNYLNNYIGINITTEEIKKILLSLNFKVKEDDDKLIVEVPTRRGDIKIKQDLAEEVARLYGYDNIVSTLPKFSKSTKGGLTYKQKLIKNLRNLYINLGFYDTINYSLLSEKEATQFTTDRHNTVKLLLPMSNRHSNLRQSLIPGLLKSLQYNYARKNENLKLLEIGKVFFAKNNEKIQPDEKTYISAVLTGKEKETKWLKEEQSIDFFKAKGYLELIFKKLDILEDISYKKINIDLLHPGRSAKIFYKDIEIGIIGEIHPTYERELGVEKTYIFEIDLDLILENVKNEFIYKEVSKYPTVTRDIAMLISKYDTYQNIKDIIKNINSNLIKEVSLFDVYEGKGLPDNKKSIAITVSYNNSEKTLTEEEILKIHDKVLNSLIEYGVTIR